MRLGQTLFGHEKLYPQELYLFLVAAPMKLWQMFAVLVIAWVHGCIGLYFWLRMKAFYRRARAVPARRRGADPHARLARHLSGRPNGHRGQPIKTSGERSNLKRSGRHRRRSSEVLDSITDYFLIGYLGLIGLVLLAKGRARR